jgi:alanine dehydrogenase
MITNEFGKGLLFGNITGVPTDVVILGAGTVGEFAAKTAIGLGASVKVLITRSRNCAVYKIISTHFYPPYNPNRY